MTGRIVVADARTQPGALGGIVGGMGKHQGTPPAVSPVPVGEPGDAGPPNLGETTSSPDTSGGQIERDGAVVRWVKRKGGWKGALAHVLAVAYFVIAIAQIVLDALVNW